MADHDQQRLIELDGNENPKVVFKVSSTFSFSNLMLTTIDNFVVFTVYKYVVFNFLSEVIFIFPLFLGMVIYANEFETKEKQKLPEIKN